MIIWNNVVINFSEGVTPEYLEYLSYLSNLDTQPIETVTSEQEEETND